MSISLNLRLVSAALVLSTSLYAHDAAAATVVVGPDTCQPGRTHYSTIQAAVSAVPLKSIVLVCPGTYPEQVSITRPLTLKGVLDGTGNAAVITVPATGLQLNANAPVVFGPLSAQLVVQNTTGVEVTNITVDGIGSGCVVGAAREAGIVVSGVGPSTDGSVAAKIDNVVVRNEHGCGEGEGIVSDSSYITVSNNQIHDIDFSGILIAGGTAKANSNNIQSAFTGVFVDSSNNSIVTGNTTVNAGQAGYVVQRSAAATVSNNTVLSSPGAVGIELTALSSQGSVNGNTVSGCSYGLVIQQVSNMVVQSNSFSQSEFDGIVDQFSSGGNVVTKNTVNEAPFGIFTDSSVGGDLLVPNALYNTVVTVDPSPTAMETPTM